MVHSGVAFYMPLRNHRTFHYPSDIAVVGIEIKNAPLAQLVGLNKNMKTILSLIFIILLTSCTKQGCEVGPNVNMLPKDPTPVKSDGTNKNESKSISDQIHDLRDTVQPGAQMRCNF